MNVKVENLGLHYGRDEALKNITFELTEKKIYGLLGRNGAGKTSFLSILASFREATSGSITMDGEVPFENANIMQQVLFLYNKDYKDESDNVKSLLEDVQRYRPNFDIDYAEHLIKRFKLDKKKPLKKFSKGMQSAFNVAVGLATRAEITIFDEVYLGMDAPSRDIFYKELLQDQADHPRVFILSTHLVSEMDYLFDEVILLHKGEILLHEDVDSFTTKGAKVTGSKDLVDEFVGSKKQLNTEQLGDTKAIFIYGEFSQEERKAASHAGLEISNLSLQDLFIHLTGEEEEYETK
ncbi:ABC transporter [Virgibacillus profundi]|uniref:ABC transporter n=1 Tax=Virgibacillus profundi TaxID=2024555 RepID=A0A2A2IEG8_9BACI|nr:ABC transporter ATP-binding protein [Virgibacillus profundi]PAV29706.1 ABC transporter [Virgibacillus profundi]PXY53878.1 ABC transporter ATP-binding protein [Virgibacillus profundi]